MKSTVDRLLETLRARGLRILPGNEPGQLLLNGPAAEKTPEVIEAVKAYKPQLLERIATGREPEQESERNRS